jgi:catechol 2,3-dioxygenase-like lactoylglutathione lyase family enzyme
MELRIVRHTEHFDDACRFYGDVLGWPVTKQWPAGDGQGRGCIFGYGAVGRVELIEHDTSVPVSGVFLGVESHDVAALHDRLLAAGATIVRGLADQPWGHRNLAVLDPTGIEIVCFQVMHPQ